MYYSRLFAIALALIVTPMAGLGQTKAAATSPQKPAGAISPARALIGTLQDASVVDGCGCYFQLPSESRKPRSERYIFMAEIIEGEAAWMNIAGKDTRLKLVRSIDPPGKERKGSRSSRTYTAGDTSVRVERVTTRVCPPNDEACESTDYAATITVSKGNRRQTIKAVGNCGC